MPLYPPVTDPKTIDWDNIPFDYVRTRSFIKYTWREGLWNEGELVTDGTLTMDVAATALHYGQSAFEGLKAFRMKDGKIRVFRPELNAHRLIKSCAATSMIPPTVDLFLLALKRVIEDNIDYVPPYESSGSLYIRPFVVGSGGQLGLSPAPEFYFCIFVNPVGDYYKGGMGNPVKALISHSFDRAAPHGTGAVKLGGNYAPAFLPSNAAKTRGYAVMLFLDPRTQTYIDEFATSNFAALTAPNPSDKTRTYVTPKSPSVLPSVTNRSLTELARKHLGWHVERRQISWEEVKQGKFEEMAAVGTAVVITPVEEVHREVVRAPREVKGLSTRDGVEDVWRDEEGDEEVEIDVARASGKGGFLELYRAYKALQRGELEGWERYGWMWPRDGIA
ncbi:hypothetical protein HK097_006997 [Rhizophlyctis rosea]|uniref:Branched-chain-amino-acid transaminase n=1 Tax=Rhizophlyctis rosea TaxID=64517 RepID=A0AAD5X2J8_9FUNG|nr:hypothetical protein HK097_006997 [Rhizophlyctis rosea]